MTYYITALTNDRARLIVSETRTNDKTIADFAWANYEARGYIAIRREEA